jgi:hypothetical protein
MGSGVDRAVTVAAFSARVRCMGEVMPVKRLILTTSDSGAECLRQPGIADAVIPFGHRFFEKSPPEAELADSLTASSSQFEQADDDWLLRICRKYLRDVDSSTRLIDLCEAFDVNDLWIDPDPDAQFTLIWLLDYFRAHETIVSKLNLVQADVPIGDLSSEDLAASPIPAIKIRNGHLETARSAWKAYREPTPRTWFDLLSTDLSALPRLRAAVMMLLEELPMPVTGLGATEMRMLELIAQGNVGPFDVFPGYKKRNERRAFSYWTIGVLLDGLARGPAPLVSGLDEGPFTLEMHEDRDRHQRYKQSRLSLTALGEAVLAGREDFSRHNPIRRRWAGTELTSDRLWRWDPANHALIEP